MTAHTMLAKLARFVGRRDIDVMDEIRTIASDHHFRINEQDPVVNRRNIDNESDRLNVRTDGDGVIISFKIG